MTSETDGRGAPEPQGPGWWLASDGQFYPPELSSDGAAGANSSSTGGEPASAGPKKVKKVKKVKKRAKPKPSVGGESKASGNSPKPAAKPSPAPEAPSEPMNEDDDLVDITDKRAGQRKFLARAPGTDQIAARQIQAKEQAALLAGARMQAALRILADDPEDQLVPATAGASALAHDASTLTGSDTRLSPSDLSISMPDTESPAAKTTPAASDPTQARPTPIGIDKPFMEVKGSALGTDIERIRERVLIFADRVELTDGSRNVLQTIRYDQLADVEIHRKLLGPTLLIRSETSAEITAKALRPELASGAKAMIEKHAKRARSGAPAEVTGAITAGTGAGTTAALADRVDRPELAAMLDELHRAGILTDSELADKRSLLEEDPRP